VSPKQSTLCVGCAAERAYLTHISHDLGHIATNAQLPAGIELAYDGWMVEING
jgi:phosphoribosyl 1,2-cyclic phosphate phosphodiesterase